MDVHMEECTITAGRPITYVQNPLGNSCHFSVIPKDLQRKEDGDTKD